MGRQLETKNNHFDFSWEFGLYKIRTVHEKWDDIKGDFDKSSRIKKNYPIELVKYNESKSSCYMIACFHLDEDGYELHSCGSRLFEEIDASEISEIWAQLQAAQKMLDAYFEACTQNSDW